MEKSKVLPVEEAAKLIKNGDTVALTGVIGLMCAEHTFSVIETRFLATGEPKDLTVFEVEIPTVGTGFEHWSHEGMVKRWIIVSAHSELSPERNQAILDNKVEAYVFPFHTASFLLRAIAERQPGYLTKVGLHTWVDPRIDGGKYNSLTKEDLVELANFRGEEYLFFKSFPIDVSILRASTADEDGNLTFEEEPFIGVGLYQAIATKTCGGKVIAQVKRVVPRGSLNPKAVVIPGVVVDAIVVDENQSQNERSPGQYVPGLDGQHKILWPPCPQYPLNHEKAMGKRVTLELRPGQTVNLGAGMTRVQVMPITIEEDIQDLVTFTVEHGVLGGLNYGSAVHVNPASFMDYLSLWTWYRGGSLDLALLSFGQADVHGNANLTRFGSMLRGPGGALDIAASCKKVIFGGTFTQGGLKTEIKDGKIRIVQEGKNKKFLNQVEHVTISGKYLLDRGQEELFITERCVFRLTEKGLELIEIAPGIDLERDILGQMEFKPQISPDLKEMDSRIFRDGLMGLRRDLLGYEEEGRINPVPFVPVEKLPRTLYWSAVGPVQRQR